MHLPGLLSRYGDDIEADFLQYYSLDIDLLYRGELSPAKVLRLIMALPKESRFARVVSGPTADWSISEYILATIADTLSVANWQRGGGKGSRPKPLPRPGSTTTERTGKTKRTTAEVLDYLEKLKTGKVRPRNGD